MIETYLGINFERSGVINKGLHHTATAYRAWSHHQHLVLLHSMEEGPHIGPYCLGITDHCLTL